MDAQRDPWERQPQESAKAYAVFCAYRDTQPSQRSLRNLAEKHNKGIAIVARWSARWGWVQRAEAWDAELDRQKRLKQVEAIQEMAERQAALAVMYQGKILERLQEVDPAALTVRDLATWLDVATKVEREARGIPQRIQIDGRVDITQRLREIAIAEGLDPDEAEREALAVVKAVERSVSGRRG